MITGASWKPFAAVRSPVVPLKENVPPGLISVPSISCETSCTLFRRPACPAVRRRVRRDDAGDAHRLGDLGRPLRLRDADGEVGGPPVGRECGLRDRLGGCRDVEQQAGRGRPDHDLARGGDLETGVLRRAGDGGRETLQVRFGRMSGDRDSRGTGRRQVEQGSDSPARHAPTRLAVREPEQAPIAQSELRAHRRSEIGVHLRLGGCHEWQRDRPPRSKRPSACTTTAAAFARSSSGPAWPSTTRHRETRRTSFASTPPRSTSRAIWSTLYLTAAS